MSDPRFTRKTIFVSCSRDMAAAVPVVRAAVAAINARLPSGAGWDVYHWARSDIVWQTKPWQEMIRRPSDPLCGLVICLFGERAGEPLPADFPWPGDLPRPDWLEASGDGHGPIAITGTIFELIDAAYGPQPAASPRKLVCYHKVDKARFADQHLSADERQYGFGDWYRLLFQGLPVPRRDKATEYYSQIETLDALNSRFFREGQRGYHCFGPQPDGATDSWAALRSLFDDHLPALLGAPRQTRRHEPKGLFSYNPADSDILYGRDNAIEQILDRLGRLSCDTAGKPPVLLLAGRSGEGKSSVLRAGLIGRLAKGLHADSHGPFQCIDTPVGSLLDADPLLALAGKIEVALGQGLFDGIDRLEDFRPELRLGKLKAALRTRLDRQPKVGEHRARLFLGLDQLDDALVRACEDPTAKARLQSLLADVTALADAGLLWSVLTIPTAQIGLLHETVPGFTPPVETLMPPGPEELRGLIAKSAKAFDLPATVIDDLTKEAIELTKKADPGPILPLLSALMAELPRNLTNTGPGTAETEPKGQGLTLKSVLDQLGERMWKELARGNDMAETARLDRLMRHLVVTRVGGGTHIDLRSCATDHPAARAAPALVSALKRTRFLFEPTPGTLRLTHAAIIDGWERAAGWYGRNRQHQQTLAETEQKAERWRPEQVGGLITEAEDLDRIEDLWFAWKDDPDLLPLPFFRACLVNAARQFTRTDRFQRSDGGSRFSVAFALDPELSAVWIDALEQAGPEGRGSVVRHVSTTSGGTALHGAAAWGSGADVSWLLSQGATVDIKRHDGQRPLHYAAATGNLSAVELLLPKSDVDAPEANGWTALHAAASNGHEAVVQLLMTRADVNARQAEQWTPLHFAAQNGHEAVVRRLMTRADVNAREANAWTPLHLAAANGHEAVVQLLMARADVDAREANAWTPLHLAASNGHQAVVQLLMARAEVDARGAKQWTPLHLAAQNGHEAVVRLLMTRADVDAREAKQWTPLHLAAQKGHEAVVRALCGRADLTARTRTGATARLIAHSGGHSALLPLLTPEPAPEDVALVGRLFDLAKPDRPRDDR